METRLYGLAGSKYTQDEEIVAGVIVGNDDALLALYQKMQRGRYYLCRRLGPQDLDYQIVDIYINVVKGLQRTGMRNPRCLGGYIRTVLKVYTDNAIGDLIVSRNNQCDEQLYFDHIDSRPNPEQELSLTEIHEICCRTLATLTPRDREILTRFYLNEESIPSIKAEMHLTSNQFRLYKNRAKNHFGIEGRKILNHKSISAHA